MAKEIVFSSKGKVDLLDYEPMKIGRNEIAGKTLVTLISPGTELAWLGGENFPIRPGYASVFEATEIGSDIDDVKIGDLLLCMGEHRSVQKFDRRFVLKIPRGLAPREAVIARLAGVTITTLMTTLARPHDKVLICGAGPVGYLAAHLFANSGYRVAVVEPNELRRKRIQTSGFPVVFPAVPNGDPEFEGKVALVVDCSGHEQSILDGCRIVRKRGEVVLVGVPWKAHTQLLAHEFMQAIFFKFATVRSGWEWEIPLVGRDFVWEELYEGYNNAAHSTMSGLQLALDWIVQGKIPLTGLIAEVPVVRPQDIYDRLMHNKIMEPFVVLNWQM